MKKIDIKKFGVSAVLLALVLMLSGCYFFVPLNADVTIENKTDKTFYYMVSYNWSMGTDDTKQTLLPGDIKSDVLKGHLTEAEYSDSTELFGFYMMEKEVYDAYIAEHEYHADDDWYVIVQKGEAFTATDKRSQNYKVVISPSTDGSENYSVELTWE